MEEEDKKKEKENWDIIGSEGTFSAKFLASFCFHGDKIPCHSEYLSFAF